MKATTPYLNQRNRSYAEALRDRINNAARDGERDHCAERELARIERRRHGATRRIIAKRS